MLFELEKEMIRRAASDEDIARNVWESIVRDVLRNKGDAFPAGSVLLETYRSMLESGEIHANPRLEKLLRLNKVRTLSGVAVVSVLTKPYSCPHNCVFCPTDEALPKSYLSLEPAVMRAVRQNFDARKQVEVRLKALHATGHVTDKIEIIILGGTFSALPEDYREKYIKELYDGLNGRESETLQAAYELNQISGARCVGVTVETRPDFIDEKEIAILRRLSVTRVELGVQNLNDAILSGVNRGHGVAETVKATKLLRDAGFKIGYHMMPNLPGADPDSDEKMFDLLWESADYQPDQLKMYPCVAVKGSELAENGTFNAYSEEELVDLFCRVKSKMAPYVRISRLFRDIPAEDIAAGITQTNLRQRVQQAMLKRGLACNCIRCREVKDLKVIPAESIMFRRQEYDAAGGKELFLTYETADGRHLISFLRLRIPSYLSNGTGNHPQFAELDDSALIREVHTYGETTALGAKGNVQHRGWGRRLIEKAEEIASQEYTIKRMAVISGVGVRPYYASQGYHLEDTYMVKSLG